jgi:hypothetical protein
MGARAYVSPIGFVTSLPSTLATIYTLYTCFMVLIGLIVIRLVWVLVTGGGNR